MTELPCTGICNIMCLYTKLSVTGPELVSLMDTLTDNNYLPFHTR